MSTPEEQPVSPMHDDLAGCAHPPGSYRARLSSKLAGMLAAAEAIGCGANDATLLRRLSIELATIVATAPSHGLDAVASRALEAGSAVIDGSGPDGAGTRERICRLIVTIGGAGSA